jgi:hypothetical protein
MRRTTSKNDAVRIVTPFRKYVATLVDRYGTADAVAKLIPMSESAFSRGVKNEGALSEENLLRLAEAVG